MHDNKGIKVLSIGEVMLELADVGDGLYRKSFAGDSFNVAHYLDLVARKWCATRCSVAYLTAVGMDAQSDACLQFLRDNGVATTRCQRDPAHTIGLFLLSNDARGEKLYGYWRGQSAARYLFAEVQDLSGYDFIYFSGITAAITHHPDHLIQSITAAKARGARIVYDFNYRALLWQPADARDFAEQILPLVDLVKISEEERRVLFPKTTVAALSKRYPKSEWIATYSDPKGEVWEGGKRVAEQIFTPVKTVVDTSAAGDSFIAAYLAAQLADSTPAERLRSGHAIAAQVVGGKGSIVAINVPDHPTRLSDE